tara:strand:- start:12503 stop:12790 length:288 start_codon:yes stop_codon:yes gene_type:complete
MNGKLGQRLSPILEEVEGALLEHAAAERGKPNFTDAGFRAAVQIFQSALMDKMWDLQEQDGMPQKERGRMAQHAGEQIKKLIHEMTGIDTYQLYE